MTTFVRRSFFSCQHGLTFSLGVLLCSAALHRAQADAVSEMAGFSTFQSVDLAKLANGKAVTARGAAMSFPRGLSVQACYIVPLPLQKTVELHKQWNAGRHPELKVYLHREISAKPGLAEFQSVSSAPNNAAVRALIDATEKLNPDQPDLQMSAAEAKQFSKSPADAADRKSMPPAVAAFWSNLLYQRTLAFLAGGVSRVPGCDTGRETIRASEEIARLLKEQPKIRDQFKPLLDDTALVGAGGKLTPSLYFELFDMEGKGAFTLGASYAKQSNESWQLVDAQYYGSDGYFVLLSFYQFWPVKTATGQGTLVWRGDLLSSASLADLHGAERMGSSGVMMKAIQKSVGFLQNDAVSRQ